MSLSVSCNFSFILVRLRSRIALPPRWMDGLDWLGFDSAKHSILDAMYELHLDRWLFLLLLVGIVAVHLPIAATFSRYAVFIWIPFVCNHWMHFGWCVCVAKIAASRLIHMCSVSWRSYNVQNDDREFMSDNFYINSFFFFFSLFFFFVYRSMYCYFYDAYCYCWLVDCLSIYSFVFFRRPSVEMVEFRKSFSISLLTVYQQLIYRLKCYHQ